MSEQERIADMVAAGKLSPEEAADILTALGDLEAAEQTLDAAQAELSSSVDEPAHGDYSQSGARETKPNDLTWLHIDFMAGDISVSADDTLSEPVIDEGRVALEPDGKNFKVQARSGSDQTNSQTQAGGLLEDVGKWVTKFVSQIGDLSVRVPPHYGVHIKSKAGDVEVKGVAFLRAELLAGDVDIRDVGALDLSAAAGDIDISFAPQVGKHRISATAGDIDVTLAGNSSVSVNARVGMGDLDVVREDAGEASQNRSATGGDSSFTVGAGAAQLDISLSAGDLDITVEETL